MPYLTPDNGPNAYLFKWLRIPNDLRIIGAVTGALGELAKYYRWEQFGTLTPQETSEILLELLSRYLAWSGSLIGSMFSYPGLLPPDGCLPCDGQIYNRVDFPELYEYLIGTLLINDADTFTTPHFPGRVVSMADEINTPFTEFGESQHALIESELAPHTHYYTPPVFNVDLESPGAPDAFAAGVGLVDVETTSTGGGEPHNNIPPTIAFNWCIVAGRSLVSGMALPTEITLFSTADYQYELADNNEVNLGLRFRSDIAANVTGVRFWARSGDSGLRSAYLWTNGGSLLTSGSATITTEGWITVNFPSSVAIDANITYVISVYFGDGRFVSTFDFFASGPYINGHLRGMQDGVDGANGLYSYSAAGTFPTSSFGSSNYWIDPIVEIAP